MNDEKIEENEKKNDKIEKINVELDENEMETHRKNEKKMKQLDEKTKTNDKKQQMFEKKMKTKIDEKDERMNIMRKEENDDENKKIENNANDEKSELKKKYEQIKMKRGRKREVEKGIMKGEQRIDKFMVVKRKFSNDEKVQDATDSPAKKMRNTDEKKEVKPPMMKTPKRKYERMKISEKKMKERRKCTSNMNKGKVLSIAGMFERGIEKEKNVILSVRKWKDDRQECSIEAANTIMIGNSSNCKVLDSREVENEKKLGAQNKLKIRPIGEGILRSGPTGEQLEDITRKTGFSSKQPIMKQPHGE